MSNLLQMSKELLKLSAKHQREADRFRNAASALGFTNNRKPKSHRISAAGRKAIAEAQRKRWAKTRRKAA